MIFKTKALIEELPFWEVEDDNLLVFQDGSFGCGFKLTGAAISSAQNSEINELNQNLENLINSAKEGLRIQLFYRMTSNADNLLEKHGDISVDSNESYQAIRDSRLDFFNSKSKRGSLFIPEVYCFLRGSPHVMPKLSFFEREKKYEERTKKEFVENKSDFLRQVSQIESSLEFSKLSPERLSVKKWFKLLFEYFNLARSESFDTPKLDISRSLLSTSFASQFVLTDIMVNKDTVQMGDYFIRAITLKSLPEGESYASMVSHFLEGIPFHFWLSQNIKVNDQKKEMEKLHLNRRLTYSMASGAKNVSDLESESKLSHIEDLMSDLLEGSEKIVSTDFTVLVWDKDMIQLDNKCDEILRTFQRMGQSEGVLETLPAIDAFLSATPGIARSFREKKVKTSNAAHLMPVYSHWSGHKEPVCLFENREGGLTSFSPFSKDLQSWNALIFAASGSGKSFAISQIAMQFFGQNPTPRIVWIDNGASSERLLDKSILDGQFIDLHLDSKICLNMFDLPVGKRVPSPSKVKLILAILEQIFKDEDSSGLPKRHKALIEEAIYKTYETENREVPTLSDLKRTLEKSENIELRNYAQILFSWTGESAYGRLLDGKTNVNLEKNLITIEIKGLDTYPDLQNVMLLNFTEFIKEKAASDNDRPTLLIIDEAWKLFETPSGRAFTIEAYRTFRKYGAGIWCISQNYKDFLINEEIANSIFPNTTSIFILKQQKIDWEDFQKRLQLNEAELEVAKSLESVKGEYSEAFLLQNDKRAILRIQADPLSYLIATTDPNDKKMIEEKRLENLDKSTLDVLKLLAQKRAS